MNSRQMKEQAMYLLKIGELHIALGQQMTAQAEQLYQIATEREREERCAEQPTVVPFFKINGRKTT